MKIEDNTYSDIYVDLISKCNFDCNFCYNKNNIFPNISINYFEEVCKLLPKPVIFKFVGGEPTLHPDLFTLIEIANKYYHKVILVSNGLMYNNKTFINKVLELKTRKINLTFALSMDGGLSNIEAYKIINGKNYLNYKLKAFNSVIKNKLGRLEIGAIIVRGLNENIIPELINLAENNQDVVRYLHFRSVGKVGKFKETEPYTTLELKELIKDYFNPIQFELKCKTEMSCNFNSLNNCCYRFKPFPRLQISLIEFASKQSENCPNRGKLINDKFIIEPFFAEMKIN